jgi:hypothetical protein
MTPSPVQDTEEEEQDPITTFMFALKAAETRRQWPKRLKMFFNFLTLQGSLADQSKNLSQKQDRIPHGPNMPSFALSRSNRKG